MGHLTGDTTKRPRTLLFALALVLAAFALRMAGTCALRDVHKGPTHQHGADPVEYNQLAINMVRGEGFCLTPGSPTSFRAPGFPLALAGLYWIAGVRPLLAYVLFAAAGAASCLLTYLLARELLEERWARVAGMLAVVYFPHIYVASIFESENIFVPLLALGVYLIVRHLKTGSTWTVVLAGLLLGFGTLTRPYALLLLPILTIVLVFAQWRTARLRLVPLAAFALAFGVVLAPWVARNYLVQKRFVLVATVGGSSFYGGNNSRVLGEPKYMGYWTLDHLPGREQVAAAPDEIEAERIDWQLGKRWVREHLAAMPVLLVLKFVRMWLPDLDSRNRTYLALQVASYLPFLVLYVLATAKFMRQKGFWDARWLVLHGTFGATVVTALIFFGCPRYRDANVPILMIYAAVGLRALVASRAAEMHAGRARAERLSGATGASDLNEKAAATSAAREGSDVRAALLEKVDPTLPTVEA